MLNCQYTHSLSECRVCVRSEQIVIDIRHQFYRWRCTLMMMMICTNRRIPFMSAAAAQECICLMTRARYTADAAVKPEGTHESVWSPSWHCLSLALHMVWVVCVCSGQKASIAFTLHRYALQAHNKFSCGINKFHIFLIPFHILWHLPVHIWWWCGCFTESSEMARLRIWEKPELIIINHLYSRGFSNAVNNPLHFSAYGIVQCNAQYI